MSPTTFHRLALAITVRDICSQIICPVDKSESADELFCHWAMDTLVESEERWDDGTGSIVLVCSDDSIIGWYNLKEHPYDPICDDFGGAACRDTPIQTYAQSITESETIDSHTPVLSAIKRISSAPNGLIVIEGNKIIGLLRANDLYKMETRMCLLSLMLGIEEIILKHMRNRPRTFIALLCNGNEKILESKKKRVNKETRSHYISDDDLFSREGFSDKIDLLTKEGLIQKYFKEWKARSDNTKPNYVNTLVDLRNKIAHQYNEQALAEIIPPEELFCFIEWLLKLFDVLDESMVNITEYFPEDETEIRTTITNRSKTRNTKSFF